MSGTVVPLSPPDDIRLEGRGILYSVQYFQYGSSLEEKAAQVVRDKDKDEEDKEEEDQEDQED